MMADGTWTEWTPKKRERFLQELRVMPNVSRAARLAKIARSTAYNYRETDEVFAAEWDDAINAGIDALEEKAWQRAAKESDTLAIFLLKAHKPALYNVPARQEHSGPNGGPIRVTTADDLSDDELARIAASGGSGTAEAT